MSISILLIFLIAVAANLVSIGYNGHFDASLNNSTVITQLRIGVTILFVALLAEIGKIPRSRETILTVILYVAVANSVMVVMQILDSLHLIQLPNILKYGGLTNLVLNQRIDDVEQLRKGGLFWSFQIAGFLSFIAIFYELDTRKRGYLVLFLLTIMVFTSRMYFLLAWFYFVWFCYKREQFRYVVFLSVL